MLTIHVFQVTLIVTLHLQRDTETRLEGVVRRGVDHALLDRRLTRRPTCPSRSVPDAVHRYICRGNAPVDEHDLVPLATVLDLVFEIVDSPSALVVGELLKESLVVGVLGLLENDDLGEGRVEAVDDKFVLPLHEVLVAVDAVIGDGDARGLSRASEHDARGE